MDTGKVKSLNILKNLDPKISKNWLLLVQDGDKLARITKISRSQLIFQSQSILLGLEVGVKTISKNLDIVQYLLFVHRNFLNIEPCRDRHSELRQCQDKSRPPGLTYLKSNIFSHSSFLRLQHFLVNTDTLAIGFVEYPAMAMMTSVKILKMKNVTWAPVSFSLCY